MLMDTIRKEAPQYIVMTFDKGRTFRHEASADYKATRVAMPDDLRNQMTRVRQIVEALGIPIVEEAGTAVGDRFKPGMRVVAANSAPCNECFFCRKGRANLCEDLVFNNGAYAEYTLIPARILRENVIEIPSHLSFIDAALIEPLACVLRGVEETGACAGDTAVVIGCGPIGLKFMRILSRRGIRVIAVGKRKSQMEAAERVGAAAMIDASLVFNPVAAVRELT